MHTRNSPAPNTPYFYSWIDPSWEVEPSGRDKISAGTLKRQLLLHFATIMIANRQNYPERVVALLNLSAIFCVVTLYFIRETPVGAEHIYYKIQSKLQEWQSGDLINMWPYLGGIMSLYFRGVVWERCRALLKKFRTRLRKRGSKFTCSFIKKLLLWKHNLISRSRAAFLKKFCFLMITLRFPLILRRAKE